MTTKERLKARLNDSPYLVIDVESGDAELETATDALNKMGRRMFFIMDLQGAFRDLEQMVAKDEFTVQDIAETAGISYQGAYAWLMRGILRPSLTAPDEKKPRYSFGDLFAAGVLGSLKRNGISLQVIKGISPLLNATTKDRVVRR